MESAHKLTSFLLQKDVNRGVRRCYVVLTFEIRYISMLTYATKSSFWRDFFSAIAESLKKLKTSNAFSSFVVC